MREEEFKKRAKEIWGELKEAKKILVCLHRDPDGDTVGSALALARLLDEEGKKVGLICKDSVPGVLSFLPDYGRIERRNLKDVNLSDWDTVVTIDCASWEQVTGGAEWMPKIGDVRVVNIDHHLTNPGFGSVVLVEEASSVSEILFHLMKEWKKKVTGDLANWILVGLVTDTGGFHFASTSARVLKMAADLVDRGADLDGIMFKIYRSNSLSKIRFWGRVLGKAEVDEEGRFVFAKVRFSEIADLCQNCLVPDIKKGVAGLFLQNIEGTEFGVLVTETSPGVVVGEVRSRAGFDVARVAVALGGGGHRFAAGFTRKSVADFDQECKKIFEVCRKVAKEEYEESKTAV